MDFFKVIVTGFLSGVKDSVLAIKWVIDLDRKQTNAIKMLEKKANLKAGKSSSVHRKIDRGPSLRLRIFQCCALSGGVIFISVGVFTHLLLPTLYYFISIIFANASFTASELWSSMAQVLTLIFNILWIVPVYVISRCVNVFWLQDIALTAFKYSFNRPLFNFESSRAIADLLFTTIIEALFLLQGWLAANVIPIPLLAFFISWINHSLLYSIYAFDYKWYYLGRGLHNRLAYVEENWYYFVGYGFLLQLITWLMSDSYLYSGSAFAVLFPVFLIGSFEAQPTPVQGIKTFRLPIFSLVVWIANLLFKRNNAAIRRN